MIDVFITTCATSADDPIRFHLFMAVWERWIQEPGARACSVELNNGVFGCLPIAFDGWRRRIAEDRATSDIYLCCDDDCMPMGRDFLKRGLAVMERHPEIPVLGARLYGSDLANCGYRAISPEVMLGSTAGGVNFIRKGVLADLLPKTKDAPLFDESSQGNALRAAGYQTGYMTEVMVNHLGASLSTLWPEPFTAKTQIA